MVWPLWVCIDWWGHYKVGDTQGYCLIIVGIVEIIEVVGPLLFAAILPGEQCSIISFVGEKGETKWSKRGRQFKDARKQVICRIVHRTKSVVMVVVLPTQDEASHASRKLSHQAWCPCRNLGLVSHGSSLSQVPLSCFSCIWSGIDPLRLMLKARVQSR